MKIKITTSCFGTKFSYSSGDVAEVTDKLGKDLISAGFAIAIKSQPKTKPKKEDINADT